MKTRGILLILILTLCVTIVNAETVILTEENAVDEITESNFASFDLVVKNNDNVERDFFITFPYSTEWRVNINPYLLRIPSGGVKIAAIQIFSLNEKNIGTYQLAFNIKSRDGSVKETYIHKVTVMPFAGNEIAMQLIVPEKIDPRAGANVKLRLENKRNSRFEGLEIVVKSDIFTERRFIDLEIGETKLEEFTFAILENTDPGEYNIQANAKYGNKDVGKDADQFLLAGFDDIIEKKKDDNTFLVKKTIISKINGGTAAREDSISYPLGFLSKYFVSYNVQPNSVTDDVAKWDFLLGAGSEYKIEVTRDYTNAFWYSIFGLVIISVVLHLKRNKIVVTKQVLEVSKDREGIKGMKVVLYVKNRGRKAIPNIVLSDTLPTVIGTFPHSFGTLHPNKIREVPFGIKIIWNIDELRGGEERIISYVAKSRLSIIGRLILTSAVAKYMRGNKELKSRSNTLTLFTGFKKDESKS